MLIQLLNQYRESKGIELNPSLVITKTISAEELSSTDILKEACKSNYNDGFDLALSKITNLDYQDSDGRTILMHALINGFYYGVDKLLQREANVDLVDNQGYNALIHSTQLPHIKYTQQIAAKTKDISLKVRTLGNSTCLHTLVTNTRKIMFTSELNDELKDAGRLFDNLRLLVVDVPIGDLSLGWKNIRTIQLNTSITVSSSEKVTNGKPINHEKTCILIKKLTSHGADIDAQNGQGLTPFFLACAGQLGHLAHLILDNYQLNMTLTDEFGFNALHWSIEVRDRALVDKVASKVADVNQRDNEGCSALLWAARY